MPRRRGVELEEAILDAAWAELTDHGYANFTVDAATRRAGTSKPVVYRRWADKRELATAAIVRAARAGLVGGHDTGSLRGDLLATLREANRTRAAFVGIASVYLGEYFRETGTSLSDLRKLILAGRGQLTAEIFERAVARGEADPAKLTPRITNLAFDLFRHEHLLTFQAVPDATLVEIVDTIVLPLVAPDETSS